MPSFPDLHEPLGDGTVALRLAAERDIPEILIAYQDDPQLHLRIGEARPPSGAELGRLAERGDADRAAGRQVTLAVMEPGSDVCIGQVHVRGVDWEGGRAELGIWVAPKIRSRGMGRAALRLVGQWLLQDRRLQRLQLLTEPDNEPLIRAAQAAGFVHEGVLRGYRRQGGARVDAAVLSLVQRDLES